MHLPNPSLIHCILLRTATFAAGAVATLPAGAHTAVAVALVIPASPVGAASPSGNGTSFSPFTISARSS